ncbi:uncharacterized protein LOC123453020 isoform X1 [Hordeum vulgare subsp. vulgare]|uniref:Predicted protein n=1 Tax=Hordeum vulgare subsp. vulgare TaxID=112509 RepID=F2DQR5_HORVV|nr:uncharacterized protein LOC123453020 isoform X1 [Hordeum vulgare subsp. vulgare]XP_044985712.1 uncharacterized protein LOC123453020 isoform X1 [Hordeum vulgare subsp. vulgare]BAJ97436.1 predicted protein [Hordeum vulgare subsp. vulgare]BAK06344.1 predicted protein [Hordeum vulgare subsp. vulgare]
MAKMSCFSILLTGRRQKRVQVGDAGKGAGTGNESPRAKPVAVESTDALPQPVAAAVVDKCGDKIVADVVIVVAHKAGEASPVKRDSLSDDFEFDFHPHPNKPVVSDVHGVDKQPLGTVPDAPVVTSGGEEAAAVEVDPSAKLKRSCSNIETKRTGPRDAPGMPVRSRSSGDLPGDLFVVTTPRRAHEASPDASVKTSRTADGVMLKRRSSSQVLPSRSRKLWWRLFLWSHRNLHRPWSARPSDAGTPGGGYTSDTLEEPADRKNKKVVVDESPPQPPSQNQWVAFCADHSLSDRVSEWVSSIDNSGCLRIAEEEDDDNGADQSMDLADDCVARPRAIEAGETSGKGGHGKLAKRCAAADDVAQANSIVQSLNGFSSVAHISGMGLKVVPMIAPFSNLRAVNLSGNFIVHISPGSLPKGLHSLDLSRNKIANVEGLRELTKLRVLNLSYNRISRIGHGLSNCTAIRELYLAGNKISDVEGLHRLLKLAVLDLGFNRLTTAKALGQLVANYHSLLALNLVGNPVQANVGDDALRKAVTDLLPQLAYLNKQPLKPREVATDSVARAALGGSGTGGRRRGASRRLSQSPGSSSSSSRSRSKGRQHHGSSVTARK